MNRFVKLLFGFFIGIITIIIGISALCIADDESAYMMLLVKNRVERVVKNYAFNSDNDKDHSSATTGYGLNLLLIDQLEDGYCKEMLSLFRDSANGNLDDLTAHMSITAFCGIQANETGFYNGTRLLKSYLPYENDQVVWKKKYKNIPAENMSLYKVDAGVYAKGLPNNGIDGDSGETVFQFDPSMASKSDVVSKLDGATNANRTKPDNKFLPDILTAVNKHFNNSTDVGKISSEIQNLDTDAIASIASAQHNRGDSGYIQYAYGIRYGITYDDKLNISANTAAEEIVAMSHIKSLSTDYVEQVLKKDSSIDPNIFMSADTARYVSVFLATEADDWYVSPYAVDSYCDSKGLEIWNKMYPDNKLKDIKSLKDRVKKKCLTVKQAIKASTGSDVSESDVKNVYGTSSAYDDMQYMSSWGNCGSIFHISQTKSSTYKNRYSNGDEPYIVSCYDAICAGHNVSTVIGGSYTYAYMLMLGGLTSVDPTNPATYMETLEDEDTFVPSGNIDWMKAYNVNTSDLSEDRIKLLTTAYNMTKVGCTYQQDIYTMDHEFNKKYIPTKLDCSGFVSKVLNNTGFTNVNKRYTTMTIYSSSKVFECISKNDVKPGDMFCSNGTANAHVIFYLSGTIGNNPGNLTIIHSSTVGGVSGPQIAVYSNGSYRSLTTSTSPRAGDTMYGFRVKGIDTGKYKTEVWTSKGKKYFE